MSVVVAFLNSREFSRLVMKGKDQQYLSPEEINDAYAKLSEGGQQTYPLGDAFWGATFGQLIDKYGNEWLLTYDHPKS